MLSFPSKNTLPKVGNVYKIVGTIKKIPAPQNLYDFNYKNYLQHKQIYYQITTYQSPVKIAQTKSFYSVVINVRNYLVSQFTKLGYNAKTKGFIEALLFGVKTNLNDELQQQFQNFGILHVLAVSGMHVVLLFSTISYVLKHLRVPKKVIAAVLLLFLIAFSLMAGFSGSVVRAALMCIMVMIGTWSKRNVDTVNLMTGSMLLILLIAPNYLFDVGFQLSYLAVFAIVYCYPVIQPYFTFKNWILNYFGQLTGLSLVAQLGVLPLSIYYFKEIPLLFLIGNLIAVPITSFLLGAWFIQMIISFVFIDFAAFFTFILNFISDFCFNVLSGLSDYFLVKTIDFHFSAVQTVVLLIFIFSTFWYFKFKKTDKLLSSLICIVMFQLVTLYHTVNSYSKKEVIVLSNSKKVVVLNRSGNLINQIGKGNVLTSANIKTYNLHNNTVIAGLDSLYNAFSLNGKKWLLIDSLSVYPKKSFDYVILYKNPKLNLERFLSYTKPKYIILHNSNSAYLTNQYISYFNEKKIPYHDMRNKGAFVIKD